jgi:hypothetical protein
VCSAPSDRGDLRALDQLHAVLFVHAAQVGLDAAAIHLVTLQRRLRARPDLGAQVQRQVAAAGEEADAPLEQLALAHVVGEAEPIEVVRTEFDRRLADLVARVRQRAGGLLEDRH